MNVLLTTPHPNENEVNNARREGDWRYRPNHDDSMSYHEHIRIVSP